MIGIHMRKGSTWAWLAAILTLATAACSSATPSGSKASSSPSDNGALKPTGSTATPSTTATSASAAPAGLRTFPLPANIRVEFQTSLPASGPQRDAVIGYENYNDSMWYAIYTYGANTAYKDYAKNGALTYVQRLIKSVSTGHQKIDGKIIYYDISVPQVFSGVTATVKACVDTSGLYYMDPKTGKDYENFYTPNALHYLEQVAITKGRNGAWFVSYVGDTSASSGGSAGACA